jgi:hypothetical protein
MYVCVRVHACVGCGGVVGVCSFVTSTHAHRASQEYNGLVN